MIRVLLPFYVLVIAKVHSGNEHGSYGCVWKFGVPNVGFWDTLLTETWAPYQQQKCNQDLTIISRGLFSFNCGWYQPKMGMLINPHGDIEILIDLQKRDTNHTCMLAWGWWWKLRLSISIKSINIYFLWLRNNSLMKSKITSSSTLIQQVHLWFAMNCLVTHEATQHLVDPSSV
jgi:hypothetical protein